MQFAKRVAVALWAAAIVASIGAGVLRGAESDEAAIAEIDARVLERQREAREQVAFVDRRGFYALRDPKERVAILRLQELSAEGAPLVAELLARGHKERSRGWIEVYRPLYILKGMGKHAKVALPDLIRALEDQHPINVFAAAEVLSNLGPDAKEAVPALLKAREKVDNPARRTGLDKAIKAIDPDAAKNAGIE